MFKSGLGFILAVGVCSSGWCSALKDNGDGTVADLSSGRTWQQHPDSIPRGWQAAHNYCSDLVLGNRRDWRLPDIKELASIVDYRADNPAIDETLFPATSNWLYWAATSYVGRAGSKWWVNFESGDSGVSPDSTENFYFRCVR